MGTTSDKLTHLSQTKEEIRNAIIAKGVSVPTQTTFRDYAAKISSISSGQSGGSYTRPSDWLPLPNVSTSEQKIVGLVAVFSSGRNYLNFRIQGNYTVDWGDGIIENFTSDTVCEHLYNYNDFAGTEIVGYNCRQAIVTITPQAGSNFTLADFSKMSASKHSFSANGFLDIRMSAPNLSVLVINGKNLQNLQIFDFIGTNQITNANSLFHSSFIKWLVNFDFSKCTSFAYCFQSSRLIKLPNVINTSSVTGSGLTYMFYLASQVEEIPQLDCNISTNLQATLQGCTSLQKFGGFINTGNVTTLNGTFANCTVLEKIPDFSDTTKVTVMASLFLNCKNLEVLPRLDVNAAISIISFADGCTKLRWVPAYQFPDISTLYYMFRGCSSLMELPAINLKAASHIGSIVSSSNVLNRVAAVNLQSATTYQGCFSNQSALTSFEAINMKVTFELNNGSLDRAALIVVFNNLQTVTGQTLNISGNPGVASLSQEDKDIALNKGWTLVL
jgi:hypothetical protein